MVEETRRRGLVVPAAPPHVTPSPPPPPGPSTPVAFDAPLCGDALARGGAGVIVERLDGTIVEVNAAACALLGYGRTELVGRSYTTLCVADERAGQASLRASLVAGKRRSHIGRWHFARKDGRTLVGDVITARTPLDTDVPHRIAWVLHERVAAPGDDLVTDATIATERLESLGLLAGGIAHDFNNVLAVIRGNVEFARDELLEPTPDVRATLADLLLVERATDRATALVRQLLAFGRMQARSPEPLELNAVIRDVASLLRVSVGGEARISLRLTPELPRVLADRTHIEQVLMNLVCNARDAITEAVARDVADGGDGASRRGMSIATSAEVLDAAAADRVGLSAAGHYVRLAVRDAGIGMTDATRARIFDPFFTTKPVDRGTGLGLAATWGMVRQSGGAIHVDTQWAEGSTFTVYLPALVEREPVAPDGDGDRLSAFESPRFERVAHVTRARVEGLTTVLLAEADHQVRRTLARALRDAGYRVLEAADGDGALELWRQQGHEIDALVTDVRLPRRRGDDLARVMRAERDAFPVVLITGFATRDPEGGAFGAPLEKPFANSVLLDRLATLLAAARDPVVG